MILSISLRHLVNLMTDTITDSNSMRETTLLNLKITNNSRFYWFECARNWKNCKVIVLDKKQKKKKKLMEVLNNNGSINTTTTNKGVVRCLG